MMVIFAAWITFILLEQKNLNLIIMWKKDFCNVVISSVDTKIFVNQYRKSDKTSFIIYADFESLIRKIDGC